ncbi:hypothetical protein SAMN06297144_2799 [Sphingomonas guangdongensis]|uniref:Uncharacterized protein n=1 Tax=Sphingomonas guangdongensis TaxID=1141890 RepID=A0A285R0K4_9SPHN|nr:hypothetical protein [Sphingomonas guangdongensis]SOB87663.1 hypothetical protein SAMN06297144_2799 [Sphingomonas guangdongensis]
MEIIKLPVGERAPVESDCISIDEQPDGSFALTGSLLGPDESVALVSELRFDSIDEAESTGLAWAADCDIATLYVTTTRLIG